MTSPQELHEAIRDEVQRVVIGHESVIEGLTISLFAKGHILLEGVPGIAKTTLANAFARASGLDYRRIQMTPDILPTDITGTNIYREVTGEFELRRGPIFANVVVADEINRATPKTQSALLEAMQEEQVTIDGETLALPAPFFVVATQNPLEMEGVFELPEAQRDRFLLKYVVDLPDRATEDRMISRFDADPDLDVAALERVVTQTEIQAAQSTVAAVHASDAVRGYMLDIVEATRESPELEHGASPRATLALLRASKAKAAISGRDYVIPDDVKSLAVPALAHRLVRSTDAELRDREPRAIVEELLSQQTPPSGEESAPAEPASPPDGE